MFGNHRDCCGQVPATGYQEALPYDWGRRKKKVEKEPVKEPVAEPKNQEKKDNPNQFPDWEEKKEK